MKAPYNFYNFLLRLCYAMNMWATEAGMDKSNNTQRDAALITGVLVLLVAAGLLLLLWKAIHAPLFWVLLVAWLVLPVLPFALRFISLSRFSVDRESDGLC